MDRRRGGPLEHAVTYSPKTSLEAAVLAAGYLQVGTDSSGREVVAVGPPRLPKVVLPKKAEGISHLLSTLGVDSAHAFSVQEGDPWTISEADAEETLSVIAAEEYLVMGLSPMEAQRRPVRIATGGSVVRLFLLPWVIAANTLDLGDSHHYLVTSTRGILGDWLPAEVGRGVVVGVPEVWVSVFERAQKTDSELLFRCDVPVPWMGSDGLVNAVPTSVGVYEARHDVGTSSGVEDTISVDVEAAWLGKVPIVMTEGSVVHPVKIPPQVDVIRTPDGPWEMEWQATYPDLSVAAMAPGGAVTGAAFDQLATLRPGRIGGPSRSSPPPEPVDQAEEPVEDATEGVDAVLAARRGDEPERTATGTRRRTRR